MRSQLTPLSATMAVVDGRVYLSSRRPPPGEDAGSEPVLCPQSVSFTLIAKHSRKCLDVALASWDDGAPVHQWTAGGGENQRWQLAACEAGYLRIVACHSGKCLDVALGSRADGAAVHQWSWVGGANQQWRITAFDRLHCVITARHSGKCLQVGDGSYRGDGARASQLDFTASDNQLWLLVPDLVTFPGPLRIASKLTCQYLGIDGGRLLLSDGVGEPLGSKWESESRVFLGAGDEGAEVSANAGRKTGDGWEVQLVGDLTYAIVSARHGRCLEAVDGRDGAEVRFRDRFAGREGQCWFLVPEIGGRLARGIGPDSFLIPGYYYPLRASSRVLVPDSAELIGAARVSEVSDSELETIPLWPYLPLPPPPVSGARGGEGDGLYRAVCRAAFWLPRYRLSEAVPAAIVHDLESTEVGKAVPSPLHGAAGTPSPAAAEKEAPAARLFLSYHNADRPLARRIAGDLRAAGIPVWMDEWEILVGDSISEKIEQGLAEATFVAVLLTRGSVRSGWVAKEWRSRIAEEADRRRLSILPLRGDDCEIPPLLRDRRYADFAADYGRALADLIRAVRTHSNGENGELRAGEAAVPRLRFVTEGGTDSLFFLLANPHGAEPAVLSGVAARSSISRSLYSGIGRIDLSRLLVHPADPEQKAGALNLSTGDFHLLAHETIRIEPGEVVPFSLRMCCDGYDEPSCTRLILRFVSPGSGFLLASDCVYIVRNGEPAGREPPLGMLHQVIVEASVPVQRVRLSPTGEIEVFGRRVAVPRDLTKDGYELEDLRWTDVQGQRPNESVASSPRPGFG